MDRENLVHILVAVVAIYGLVLVIAALGGGIQLSLGSPWHTFPIILPKETLYVFLVASVGVTILDSELVDKWVNAIINFAAAVVSLAIIQGTPGMVVGGLLLILAIWNLVRAVRATLKSRE
jgi:hypothetical protein